MAEQYINEPTIQGPIYGAVAIDNFQSGATIQLGANGKPIKLSGRDVYFAPSDGWDQILTTGTVTLLVFRSPLYPGRTERSSERPGSRSGSPLPTLTIPTAGAQLTRRTEWSELIREGYAYVSSIAIAAVAANAPIAAIFHGGLANALPILIRRVRVAVDGTTPGAFELSLSAGAPSGLVNQPVAGRSLYYGTPPGNARDTTFFTGTAGVYVGTVPLGRLRCPANNSIDTGEADWLAVVTPGNSFVVAGLILNAMAEISIEYSPVPAGWVV